MPAPANSALPRADQDAFEDALRTFRSTSTGEPSPGTCQAHDRLGVDDVDVVKKKLVLDQSLLKDVLGVSVCNLQCRRKEAKDLTPLESDRLSRLLHIGIRSLRAFASDASARSWLKTPHGLLDGETPLQRLDTEPGLREVEDLLTTIDETGAA
jgi:putative toxin-antitoxin system antitoxin component (TIGR02293 family)